jgi:hypothetical protein
VNFTTMFEDYAAGVALLTAAFAVWRGYRWALAWLIVTWSGISFLLLISTVGQLEALDVGAGLGSRSARSDHDRDGCP